MKKKTITFTTNHKQPYQCNKGWQIFERSKKADSLFDDNNNNKIIYSFV